MLPTDIQIQIKIKILTFNLVNLNSKSYFNIFLYFLKLKTKLYTSVKDSRDAIHLFSVKYEKNVTHSP